LIAEGRAGQPARPFSFQDRECKDPAVTVTLRDARPSVEDRAWIARHYPEYVNELALRVSGTVEPFLIDGEHGNRQPEWLLRWFRDDRTHPLLILSSGQPAGFALVARPLLPPMLSTTPVHEMAEFFIRVPLSLIHI
jgi:hypothetical protein